MSGRYAKLGEKWLLRGWDGTPPALAKWATGDLWELGQSAFYVAEACDGRKDLDSLAFHPDHRALLEKLIAKGTVVPCSEGDDIAERQRYRRAANPRITHVQWSVTGRCNLRCRHCYMEAPSGRYGHSPTEALLRLIDQLERANVITVSLTGGEPFLRRDLATILAALVERRIGVRQIYSNGILITEEALDGIRRLGLSPTFHISFDGVGTHDSMRGKKGAEAAVLSAIRRLRTAGFNVGVSTSVDAAPLVRLEETYNLLRRLDINSWHVCAPVGTGNWKGTTTAVTLAEEADAYEPLLARWLADGRPFGLQLGGFFCDLRQNGTGGDEEPTRRYTPESYDCEGCREAPNLLPDGTLLPCPGYVGTPWHGRMPNLLRGDLSKVWSRSLLRSVLNLRKADLLTRNEECRVCDHFAECGCGCRASALIETGYLKAKDPIRCTIHKEGLRERFREQVSV